VESSISPAAIASRTSARPAKAAAREDTPKRPAGKAKPKRSVILLWMSGGPSQIDTFDPKPDHANGKLFGAIDTTIKGVKISDTLPQVAKLTNHLAIIRSLTHREGDHTRGTYLMQTGHTHDGLTRYPALGSVLAKELSESRPDLPRYFGIARGKLFPR